MRTPSARSARPSRSITPLLVSRSSNSSRMRSRSSQRLQVVEQVGLAAHDQLAVVAAAAGPAGEAGRDDLLASAASSSARLCSARVSSSAAASPSVLPADARVEVVRGLDQRRGRQARRQRRAMRFSTEPSSPTSTTSARAGSSRTNSMCLSRALDFGVSTTPAPRGSGPTAAAEPRSAPSSTVAPGRPPASGPRCASRSSLGERRRSASAHRRRTAGPVSVGSRPAEVCGA